VGGGAAGTAPSWPTTTPGVSDDGAGRSTEVSGCGATGAGAGDGATQRPATQMRSPLHSVSFTQPAAAASGTATGTETGAGAAGEGAVTLGAAAGGVVGGADAVCARAVSGALTPA